ncbi:MAG: fumarate hydratase, class II [Candidatus Cloacimonadota bacterium]|nr:MAG: fumarate hydratase, class II [Candidatus Cloacimonadota bacterium]PIE77338.1 MAG: fumarate hydratase, class II [Candidatus Delongbacteria bacterium]
MIDDRYRIEHDTMGEIKVPIHKYWGAQTQRSFENFKIGEEKIPNSMIRAFALLKKSVAMVNKDLNQIDTKIADAIIKAAEEIAAGTLCQHFPLSVWQTGSGTQSNMNMNEVIANRATEILGGNFKEEKIVHPNDHVNMGQSSNDTFPTAMHIAAVIAIEDKLLPSLDALYQTLKSKSEEYSSIVKIGRTHLQDATPLTMGQEVSGWAAMLEKSKEMIVLGLDRIRELALGGTAVGTGLNAHYELPERFAKKISEITGKKFITSSNKFHALSSHDGLVFLHGALKALATDLMKIVNDVRWLASGPRCGIGELEIPANEPGSSIMPGKVNPTQAEAVSMVACQVFGNDSTIAFASSQGNFELNAYKPVIIYNFQQSVWLLTDAMKSFNKNCAVGIKPNIENIEKNLSNSLMLVTALNPYIGYENAAKIAKKAYVDNSTLKEAAIKLNLLTEEEFERYVRPEDMTKPRR